MEECLKSSLSYIPNTFKETGLVDIDCIDIRKHSKDLQRTSGTSSLLYGQLTLTCITWWGNIKLNTITTVSIPQAPSGAFARER